MKLIYEYLFEEVVKERVLLDPNMVILFSRLRLIYPLFKKTFILGLLTNFMQFLTLVIYCWFFLSYLKDHSPFIYLFFLYFSILQGLIGGFFKIFIIYYLCEKVHERDTLAELRHKVRKLVVSRIFTWSRYFGYVCYIINLFQLFCSIFFLFFYQDHNLVRINFMTSLLFFLRMVYYINELNKIINTRIPMVYVNEILMEQNKIVYDQRIHSKYSICVICYNPFKDKEELHELNCSGKHIFHISCIKNWFSYQNSCPMCKKVN